MNADKAQFEDDRDFQMNQYGKFMSNILGRSPMAPPSNISPNLYNPNMSGLMGAIQGFGMGGQIANAFGGGGNAPAVQNDIYPTIGSGNTGYGFGFM